MENYQIKVKDHLLSGKVFTVVFNQDKGIGETKIPRQIDLDSYYPNENYASHQDQKQGLIGSIYNGIQYFMLRYKLSIVKRHSRENSLLDIGGGTGTFANFFSKKGYEVTITEPNRNARIKATEKGLSAYASISELPSDSHYSTLSLWHVFEHLPHPVKSLQKFHKLLNKRGLLLLALPNFRSFDAQYYQKEWAAFDVPRHLWHYSPKGLISLVSAHGFHLEKTYPLWFDAFYIAYLSEQYRKTNLPHLRALFIGLRSNLSALFSGQYSSLIYVFRKED